MNSTKFGLNLELDVQFASNQEFSEIAMDWLDSLAGELAAEPWLPYERPPVQGELPPRPELGPPGSLQGTIEVALYDVNGRRKGGNKPYGPAGVRWLRDQLVQLPQAVNVAFDRLDEHGRFGTFGLILYVRHDPKSPGWMRLQSDVPEAAFVDQRVGAENQRRWLAVLRRYAERLNPGFGQVAYAYSDGATALEDRLVCLDLRDRDPAYTVGESRAVLRGYGWLTIVPQELVERLGGAPALAASGAFVDVAQLEAGGAWLLATDDYREFGDEQLERVFRVLAPVLRRGEPTPMRDPYPGMPPYRIVYRDAADVTGG